jgi:hypothetical protein
MFVGAAGKSLVALMFAVKRDRAIRRSSGETVVGEKAVAAQGATDDG